jgi:hypothetical protein
MYRATKKGNEGSECSFPQAFISWTSHGVASYSHGGYY